MTDEDRATELVVQFKADVLAVVTRDEYDPWPAVVVFGLIDIVEALMRRGVRLDPAAMPHVLARLDQMRANVQGIAPLEPPSGPMH